MEALEAGHLVGHTVAELAFGSVVAAIVECSKRRVVLRKLLSQIAEIRRLTSEVVRILSTYDRYASRNYLIPHAIRAGSLQLWPHSARVLYLLEDLAAFSGGVGS